MTAAARAYERALAVLAENRWLPGAPDPPWVRRDQSGQFSTTSSTSAPPTVARPEGPDTLDDLHSLRRQWGDLDRQLLPYAGNPRDPMAVSIINEQKQIIERIHHHHLDEGGPEGVGLPGGPRDVVVVGAGPAGLAAAIYGGTEGLDALLVDAGNRPGGQAAMSSRIENVMGFPSGVTGRQLAETSLEQAKRVGTATRLGVTVQTLSYEATTGLKRLSLSDGTTIETRAVVVAGGVQFRKMDFPGADAHGVVYGDSNALKDVCKPQHKAAVLVGGANSAGQAAIDAAATLPHVTLIVRSNIEKGMSSYLIDQLRAASNVTILERAEIASVQKDKDGNVLSVTLKDGQIIECGGVGLFIGSAPKASWAGVEVDQRGYIKTGFSGRPPLESSIPGVFAAGDIRAENKVHRVATAAGEGALSISLVHQYIPSVTTGMREADTTPPAPAGAWTRDTADKWMDAIYRLDREQPFTGLDDEADDPHDPLPAFREGWSETLHPRGKTTPGSTPGSFMPRVNLADQLHELGAGAAMRLPDGRQVVRTRATQHDMFFLKDASGRMLPSGHLTLQDVLADIHEASACCSDCEMDALTHIAFARALDVIREVDWNPVDHPRGRSVLGTNTGSFRRENIGVTPFRGRSRDPGHYRQSSRYKSYEHNVQRIAKEEDVAIEEFQHVAGLWEGEQEPADSLWVKGDPDAVRRFGLRIGKRYNQDGVMFFDPVDDVEKANGALVTVPGVPDAKAAYKLLDVLGQPGGRYFDGKVQTAVSLDDVDVSWFEKIAATVEGMGLGFEYDWGRVDFPGKPYPPGLREGAHRSVPQGQQGREARHPVRQEGDARDPRPARQVGTG